MSVKQVNLTQESIDTYLSGKTIEETAKLANISVSSTRRRLSELGVLRTKKQASAIAVQNGRHYSSPQYKKRGL